MEENYNLYCQRVDDDFFDGRSIHEKNIVMTPLDFSITRVYPNPFNSQTKIQFFLPGRTLMEISLFDQVGRELLTITEGYREAGFYDVPFNACNLPSGCYLLRLKADNRILSERIIVTK
ncbi:MAG: T9SS type A sorting domain-containing protein [Candidatus Hatepunaea meridiana]|nr:T9SS type A sorting domain-containing protein [Candidatus Hatepunaea meridiana]